MAKYDFKEDLIEGEKGEHAVIKDLESMGAEFISNNKDNRYDVKMKINGKEIKYEIKTDVYCKPDWDTNNIFIEYECRGKKSGIEVTEAKWFVTYFKYLREIWYIQTETLKHLLNMNKFHTTEFSGDNGSNTKGYLMPRYRFKKHFIIRRVIKNWDITGRSNP